MRYLGIFVVLAGVIAALLFNVPIGHGKPLLDWQQARDNWTQPAQWLTTSWSSGGRSGEKRVYRWRDATGSWQYGQIPPPGVSAEPITVKAPDTISAEEMRGGKGLEETQQKQ